MKAQIKIWSVLCKHIVIFNIFILLWLIGVVLPSYLRNKPKNEIITAVQKIKTSSNAV